MQCSTNPCIMVYIELRCFTGRMSKCAARRLDKEQDHVLCRPKWLYEMKPYEVKNILETDVGFFKSGPSGGKKIKKPAPTIESMIMDQPSTLDGYYF